MKEQNLQKNYELKGQLLKILTFPHPFLSKKANPVEIFDEELATLAEDMLYTMYMAPGIGLAANQVGKDLRLIVMDIDYDRVEIPSDKKNKEFHYSNFNPYIFVNPVISLKKGTTTYQEGCLSVPGIYEDVERSESLFLNYQDLNGHMKSLSANDLLSICIQHEFDHLEGIVFLDRLGSLKRKLIKNKIIKQLKKSKN